VGRSDRRTTERGIEANAPGAGLTDPPEDSDGRGSGGGPVRFIGGAIDPVDGEGVSRATLSDLDEMALPNAGLIDPPDDAPIGGDSPSVGGAAPIIGGDELGAAFSGVSML